MKTIKNVDMIFSRKEVSGEKTKLHTAADKHLCDKCDRCIPGVPEKTQHI